MNNFLDDDERVRRARRFRNIVAAILVVGFLAVGVRSAIDGEAYSADAGTRVIAYLVVVAVIVGMILVAVLIATIFTAANRRRFHELSIGLDDPVSAMASDTTGDTRLVLSAAEAGLVIVGPDRWNRQVIPWTEISSASLGWSAEGNRPFPLVSLKLRDGSNRKWLLDRSPRSRIHEAPEEARALVSEIARRIERTPGRPR